MKKLMVSKTRVSELSLPSNCGIGFNNTPYTLEKIGLTQSLLSHWQTCRKSFLIAINRYTSLKKEMKTGYGSLMHDVLDVIYTGHMEKQFKYNDFIDVITESIDNYQFNKVWSEQNIEIAKAKAQALLENYIVVFKDDFKQFAFAGVEEIIQCRYENVLFRGKRDGIFEDKKGGLWNLEHKNFGKINEETLGFQLNFDLQNLLYLLIDELLNKRYLKGTVYNIIRNPQTRKKLSPSELYTELNQKIKKEPDYYFYRYWVPYSRKQLMQFKQELKIKIIDLKTALIASKEHYNNAIFYRNEKACTGVAYTCDYLEACGMDCLNGYLQTDKFFPEL